MSINNEMSTLGDKYSVGATLLGYDEGSLFLPMSLQCGCLPVSMFVNDNSPGRVINDVPEAVLIVKQNVTGNA